MCVLREVSINQSVTTTTTTKDFDLRTTIAAITTVTKSVTTTVTTTTAKDFEFDLRKVKSNMASTKIASWHAFLKEENLNLFFR